MKKYNWEDKEKFLEDWENSKNKCDFLIKQNMTATSGNYSTFNKWLKFHTKDFNAEFLLSHNEVFIENSPCSRNIIKKVIIKQMYRCLNCEKTFRK